MVLHLPLPFVLSFTEKLTKLILPFFSFPATPSSLIDFSWPSFSTSPLKLPLWMSWMTPTLQNLVVICCPDLSQPFSRFRHSCLHLSFWHTLFFWFLWHHTLDYFPTPPISVLSFFSVSISFYSLLFGCHTIWVHYFSLSLFLGGFIKSHDFKFIYF